jgi:acyl dehydratase
VIPRAKTYLEDVEVGDEERTPAITVTAMHVALYRGVTGDAAVTEGTVPELLPICLSTGLGWRMPRPPLVVLAFMGFEWQIVRPLAIGDTIYSRAKTAVKRTLRDAGVVVDAHEIVDQRGDVVQRGRFTFLVAKRPVESGANGTAGVA